MEDATSVYLYYDAYDVLIYVGVTARGARRQAEHNKDKPWWSFVDHQDVEHLPTRAQALSRESTLIRSRRPPFNTQQNDSHASALASYLLFREQIDNTPEPMEALRQSGGRIPLGVLYHRGGDLELVTPILFGKMAQRLRLTAQPKAIVGTTRCGMVTGLVTQGPTALLKLTVRRGTLVADPFLRVRTVPEKSGPRFEIKNVQLLTTQP